MAPTSDRNAAPQDGGASGPAVEALVRGAKTAVSAAATASTGSTSAAPAVPAMSSREAVTTSETGLTSTNARSGPGSVAGSTNTLDRNVRANMNRKPAFMTAFGERSTSPSAENTHDRPKANSTTRPSADAAPVTPASGRNPSATPSPRMTVPAST